MASTRTLRPRSHEMPVLERDEATGVERFSGSWSGHQTQHHAHPEYQVTVGVAGRGRFEYLGGRAIIPPSCMAIFHPAEPHILATADRVQPWTLRSLHIPAHWFEEQGQPLYQPTPIPLDDALRSAFDDVWTAFATNRLPAALRRLATTLFNRPGLEPVDRDRSELVRRCLNHLAATLDRPVSCAELARLVRGTPAQIRRAIVTATGLPPHAWHVQRRIVTAKHQLTENRSISEVALSLGFADQAHFTRHFTKLVGVSPLRYIAGVRSGMAGH